MFKRLFNRRTFLKGGLVASLISLFARPKAAEAVKENVPANSLREILRCRPDGIRSDSSGRLLTEVYRWDKVRMSELEKGDLFVMREVSSTGVHTKFMESGPPPAVNRNTDEEHYRGVQPAVLKVVNDPFPIENSKYADNWGIDVEFHSYIEGNPLCANLPGVKIGTHSS